MNCMVSDADTIETIVVALGRPLRQKNPEAAIAEGLKIIRKESDRPFPDAATIKRHAAALRQSLELLPQLLLLPNGDDGPSSLGGLLASLMKPEFDGPSPSADMGKHLCAVVADGLVNRFSMNPSTGTAHGQTHEIAGLLYQAVYGEEAVLKHYVDAVRRSWRGIALAARGR